MPYPLAPAPPEQSVMGDEQRKPPWENRDLCSLAGEVTHGIEDSLVAVEN